jgi:uncharacterized protein (DUF1800 family)
MKKALTQFALAILLVAVPAADSAKPFQAKLSKDKVAVHALDRLTFGARPGDRERVKKLGFEKFLDEQLHPEKLVENPALAAKLEPLKTLSLPVETLIRDYPPRGGAANSAQVIARELNEAKLQRAIYSTHQLEELMVDFWYNHFNVFFNKGADRHLVPAYEREAIRPHVLGKFRDMLVATAHHPAMLFYLDNWQSSSVRGLNENYARELMELHTLGVDGGYTQKDVTEVARCFTGWTILQPRVKGTFFFARRQHDNGEKTVLGVTIPAGGGKSDGDKVLELVAKHPSTARFISRKLAVRFVADDAPPELIERMAKTFRETDGDIRAVLRTMFLSREFLSETAYRAKVKSPFEMVVSAARAANAEVESAAPLAQQLARMGQPLYRKVEPTGYSSANAEWVNSSALLARMNFAVSLSQNKLRGIRVPLDNQGLQLGSPDFQRR